MMASLKRGLKANPLARPLYMAARKAYLVYLNKKTQLVFGWVAWRDEGRNEKSFRWNGFIVTEGQHDIFKSRCLNDGLREYRRTADQVLRLLAGCEGSPVVFDVGANIGIYSLLYARFPDARVYSFEPVTTTYAFLARNVMANGLGNVEVFNHGFYDADGELYIGPWQGKAKSGTFTVDSRRHDPAEQDRGEMADFHTLDGFVRDCGLDRIDFLKIDTEGAELAVLRGGAEIIRRFRPVMEIEVNKRIAADEAVTIFDFLGEHGYDIFLWNGHELLPSDIDHFMTIDHMAENIGPDVFAVPRERAAS
jgi:FkbM family methyltransferase